MSLMRDNAGLKKHFLASLICCLLALGTFFGTAGASTLEVIDGGIDQAAGKIEIPFGTSVNGDVKLNMGEIIVLGVVNGNVTSNMGTITVEGDVNGNVEADMGQIKINGRVSGDVVTRVGDLTVNGSVNGDLFSDLGTVRILGSVGGDVTSGIGDVYNSGQVGGDIDSKGGKVEIDGIVEGNITLGQGLVELGPLANVSGHVAVGRGLIKKEDAATIGSMEIGEELTLSELEKKTNGDGLLEERSERGLGGRIAESVIGYINTVFSGIGFLPQLSETGQWQLSRPSSPGFFGSIARGMVNMLIWFALAALTNILFPKNVKVAGQAVLDKTGPVIGWGVLAAFLAIPVMIFLAITIIGIPLILVLIAVLFAAAVLGYTAIVGMVGERVVSALNYRGSVNSFGAIAVGIAIIGLVSIIPFIGSLAVLAVYVVAIGAALVTRFGLFGNV